MAMYITRATLISDNLEARCDVLTRVRVNALPEAVSYEPTIVTGTYSLTNEQKIEVAFAGYVLGQIQHKLPVAGTVVGMGGHVHGVDLQSGYRGLRVLLDPLRHWVEVPLTAPPPVILNKHCPSCPFQAACRDKAETDDDLSLLDRMTSKARQRYQRRGIFTVTQLSYLYRPQKRVKRRPASPAPHKLELQALAIRMGKTYLQEVPHLPPQQAELFLDIEGNPDQAFYYLIGLLVCDGQDTFQHSFWADTPQEEAMILRHLLSVAAAWPDAPIYHYGNYETAAISRMAKRYQMDCDAVTSRMVNMTGYIYGKVYFPIRSNSLKDIGRFLGASWTAADASGLQSLVWRHRWEKSQSPEDKHRLVTYNREDCVALKVLADQLRRIEDAADALPDIDFADRPKRVATDTGGQLHNDFEAILRSAHFDYDKKKLALPRDTADNGGSKKRGAEAGHQGHYRVVPARSGHVVRVAPRQTCPHHDGEPLRISRTMAEKVITDLAFTKSGCRKVIARYVGPKAYCPTCHRVFCPPDITKFGSACFGHGLQSWVIYQRLALRLPYRIIVQTMEDQFNEAISQGTITNFMRHFFNYYVDTEDAIIENVLKSPFVHVDETRIDIQGSEQYAWVFTDGKHVFFRLTRSREADIVHELLADYQGVLVSDFYGGYDAVKCKQQKCLVHLIRDINQDLWDYPFDGELESFVLQVKNLLIPILSAVDRYGLKKRHLGKFTIEVQRFYRKTIDGVVYHSELACKYQKRFDRYRESLFTFLEQDSIPWNNNMAERGIRHLAVQRKISGTFFESAAPQYLRLLGITQTCRFQGKSLLKFLISGEKDIDMFRVAKKFR
jgi:predicted RecB family nuclease